MSKSLDTIRHWLSEHMPSLSRATYGMTDRDCHAHLCEYLGMEYERGEVVNLAVLLRKLKQAHFGG